LVTALVTEIPGTVNYSDADCWGRRGVGGRHAARDRARADVTRYAAFPPYSANGSRHAHIFQPSGWSGCAL